MVAQRGILSKTLVVGVIVLFLGVAVQPSVATVEPKEEMIDVEPKDYLVQTIINIANNPDIKSLLEQYKDNLLRIDFDRSVYHKIFFRNPRLLLNVLFTKPFITYDYLDKSYNIGLEVTNIIGEDKSLEMIESIELTDPEIFDKLNNILSKDEELTFRIATLKEMNKVIISKYRYPIICNIIIIIIYALFLIFAPLYIVTELYELYGLFPKLADICYDIIVGIFFFMISLITIGALICSYDFPNV